MENLVWYTSPADNFNEALPLGNGHIGAMVYGKTDIEKISLNHDTLWSGTFARKTYKPSSPAIHQEARKLVLEGRPKAAEALLESGFSNPWVQNYLPLGNLYIKTGQTAPTGYRRSLRLDEAAAEVTYCQDGVKYCRQAFISYPDQCFCLRLESNKPADISLWADSQLRYTASISKNTLLIQGEAPSHLDPIYHTTDNPIRYDGGSIRFTAMFRAVTNGALSAKDHRLVCRGATETTIYITVTTNYAAHSAAPDKDFSSKAAALLDAAAQKGWDQLWAAHTADFSALYNRVRLTLDAPASPLSTEDRLKQNHKDLKFYELVFNFGRYLLISASRPGTQATNLQGIWNEELQAPWSSNYTVNINTEMNYWPALICHLPECCAPLHDLIEKIRDTGRQTAKDFYQAPGFVCHHNSDIWGHTTPVGAKQPGSCRFAVWNMSGAWFCRHLYEYFLYTQDMDFLRDTAYPTIREAVEFYRAQLIEYQGHLIFSPGTSPENAYLVDGNFVVLAPYSTMTQGILMDLFSMCIHCGSLLQTDAPLLDDLSAVLPKLNTFTIGSKGQLLEWDQEYPEEDPNHRHVSHLYSLHPGLRITPESTPELAQACRRSLELRGDEGTGWSLAWKMIHWAHLFDGDHAASLLDHQLRYIDERTIRCTGDGGGTYLNLFAGHPPFQIDANFGITAGIAHLFLQYHDDCLYILPALPKQFPAGEIRGLLAPGSIAVDICWQKGKLTAYTLTSPIDQEVLVDYNRQKQSIYLDAGIPLTIRA